jgi:hypothetical protein
MNTRIRKKFSATTGMVIQGEYHTNFYQIDVAMTTVSDDAAVQNTAYDRICYWIEEVFNDSVLINQNDECLAAHEATGRRILSFDHDPIDGVIGLSLFHKLTAIVQGNLNITDLDISSVLGQEVVYQHSDHEIVDEFDMPGWCTDPGPGWSQQQNIGNVVSLERAGDWKKLGLHWKRTTKNAANTIMLAAIRDEDQ